MKKAVVSVFAALVATTSMSGTASAQASILPAFDTFADIACKTDGLYPTIQWKGWGIEYPTNTAYDAIVTIHEPSAHAEDYDHPVRVVRAEGKNGSWSYPTTSESVPAAGTWGMTIKVYRQNNGGLLNSATDSCTF